MTQGWRASLAAAIALALQHHPLCRYFAEDRYRLGRVRLCSGCAMALPGFALGVLAAFQLLAAGAAEPLALVASGLALGAPQGLTYLVRFSRGVRAAVKFQGGLGLGLATLAWVFAPVHPLLWWGAPAALGLVFLALQAVRLRSILATCRRCPWAMDWEHCPGFRVSSARATD